MQSQQLGRLRDVALAIRQDALDVFPLYSGQAGDLRAGIFEFFRGIDGDESLITA